MLVTSGDPGSGNALIKLTGVGNATGYIIFDGRAGGTGSTVGWTIRNTRTTSIVGPAFQFTNGCAYDILQYCQLESYNTTATSGTVYLYNSSTGPANNHLTIQNCNIGPYSTYYPVNGICAYGYSTTYPNSYISVLDNNIYNFLPGSTAVGSAVCVTGTSTNTNYGDNWTISGNSIYNSVTQVNGYYVYPIYFIPGTGSTNNTISNNYIGGQSALCGGTGSPWVCKSTSSSGITVPAFAGMFIKAGSATITGNTISNIQINNTNQNGHAFGIDVDGTSGSSGFIITGNTIGNPSPSGSAVGFQNTGAAANGGSVCGIVNQAAGNITIGAAGSGNGNIIANLSNVGSSVNTPVAGIVTTTGVNSIVNNTIFNLTAATLNTATQVNSIPFDGCVVGILSSTAVTGQLNINDNTIYNLISSGTSAAATRAVGINVNGIPPYALANGSHSVDGNKIYNISTTNTNTSAIIAGIRLSGSSSSSAVNFTISNNMVMLGYRGDGTTITGSAQISGIFDNSSGYSGNPTSYDNNIRVWHNTVYIGGTGVTGGAVNTYAFYRYNTNSSPKNVEKIYNNIFVNDRSYSVSGTGFNAGIGLDNNLTYSPNLLSTDYNLVYGTGVQYRFGYITSTSYATKAAWVAANATFDPNSQTTNPQLIDPTSTSAPDLHVNTSVVTPVEGAGTGSYTMTYDFDGDTRASLTPTDIVADAGDFQGAPNISYTALANTSSLSNAPHTATITSANGINVTSGTKPRIYFKRTYEANTFVDNTNATDGWKYTEATNSSSPFTFLIDYSLLYNSGSIPVAAGDYIQYFVVAQDNNGTPTIGINSGVFNATPSSVDDYANIFPLGSPINQYWILPSQGSYTIGVTGRPTNNYTSLTRNDGFFAGMDDPNTLISGDITMSITADISIEDGANGLNQWTESPPNNVFTVTVQPDASANRNVYGTYAGGLFRLNGCERVIFDGSNGTTSRYLTFYNSTAAQPTFVFINDATGNTLNYCNIYSSNTSSSSGTILFSTGTSAGNDNNTISNCDIYQGSSVPYNAIYSLGSASYTNSGNTIKGNLIRNFTNYGINISSTGNGDGWTIGGANAPDGNSIYNESARSTALVNIYFAAGSNHTIRNNSIFHNAAANTSTFTGIQIAGSGNGITIRDNYIGGTQAQCGGTALLSSYSGAGAFIGITAAVGTTTDAEIHNNTIKNITNSGAASSFTGIAVTAGIANIGTSAGNTIGDVSIANSISLSGSGATSPITITGAGNGSDISNNTIAGFTTSSNNAFVGITLTVGTTTATSVQGNTIKEITMNGNVASSFKGIYVTAGKVNIGDVSSNNIGDASLTDYSSITYAGTLTCYGIYSAASAASVISNNYIANIYASYNSSGTAVILCGIYHVTNAVALTITGNTIKYLKSNYGNTNALGATSSVEGISVATSAAGSTISQNTIHTLQNTYATGAANHIAGIYANLATSGTNIVSKNFVHSLKSTNATTAGSLCGIYLAAGLYTCDNNMIRLGVDDAGADINNNYLIYGIYQASAAVNSNIYFNSVYIGGSAVAPAGAINTYGLFRNNTIATNVKNNIFMNARSNNTGTGTHYSISISAITGYTGDNNLFYTPGTGGKVGKVSTTDYADLTAWKSGSTQDALSVSGDPHFLYPANDNTSLDLHIDAASGTQVESGGIEISGITYDFDAAGTRPSGGYPLSGQTNGGGNAPDIGADEGDFVGVDLTPPMISYTPLSSSVVATGRSFTDVGITDASGVNITNGTKSRCYYKKSTDANTYAGNTSSDDGWKYVEASGTTSPFSFYIDYSILNGGSVVANDIIQYFVVAQDLAPAINVGINSGTFTSYPASVDLASGNFPLTGTINQYTILPGVNAEYYVGASSCNGNSPNYATLTGASGFFAFMNTSGTSMVIDKNITVYITSDITETGVNALNQWTEDGNGPYTLTIVPCDATLKTLSGSVSSNGLIPINGADRVIFDGRYAGSGKYLKFKNTYATAGTAAPTFKLYNNSTYNTIEYCYVEGQLQYSDTYNPSSGVIMLGTSTAGGDGNSYNTVSDCDVYGGGSSWYASTLIYSCGLAGTPNHDNAISNNNLYNFCYGGGGTTTRAHAINITATGNGSNWTISGNSIYNTFVNGTNVQSAITFLPGSSSTGNIISNNWIGGKAPLCGAAGTPWENSYDPYNTTETILYGMQINVGTITIDGNNITNIKASSPDYTGIQLIKIVGSTVATITNNVFGSGTNGTPDNSKIIQCSGGAGTSYGPGYIYGIWNTSNTTSMTTYDNNDFYYLWQSGAGYGGSVQCIVHQTAGPATITNNQINGPQAVGSADYGAGYNSFGIRVEPTASNTGNIIRNNRVAGPYLNNTSALTYESANYGIRVFVSSYTVSGTIDNNVIWDMRNADRAGYTEGIYIYSTTGGNGNWDIYNNQITLKNNGSTSNCVGLYGIDIALNSASTTTIRHNTVYIGGSNGGSPVAGHDFSSYCYLRLPNSSGTVVGDAVTVQNNIFINSRLVGNGYVAGHFAIANQGTSNYATNWNVSDNNFLFTNNGTYNKIGCWGSTAQATLANWRTASSKDANSYTATVTTGASNFASGLLNPDNSSYLFNNPLSDLHISISDGQSYQFVADRGTTTSITTDFDGESRPMDAAPDLGADEFTATCTNPTLSGASQAAEVCGSGPAIINLTGLVASSTDNAIDYTINGVQQTQVTGIDADGSGNASFTTTSLTTGNNGHQLVITKITNGACFTNFSQSVVLQVTATPTLTGASQASAVCGSGTATINMTGLVASSTGNAIDYTINGVPQTQVTGVSADGSGNASFTTTSLTTGNNGQQLVITAITNNSCSSNFSQSVVLQVSALPTLTGASQSAVVCGSGTATIDMTGLVAGSTGNAIDYTINSVPQTQVTGVNADGSGNASFVTSALTTGNNGQQLVITKITNGTCYTDFTQSVVLQVEVSPTLTGASQASLVCGSGEATINMSGLVAGSTGNAIDYTINGVPQTQITGINANGSGNASFNTSSLTTANNGQQLVITRITNGNCYTDLTQSVSLQVTAAPTLTGASQATVVCGSGSATINLTGMVANSTGNAINYSINGVPQTQVTGVNVNGSGDAGFNTSTLTNGNNGQQLVITRITNGSCYTDFTQGLLLGVEDAPTLTGASQAAAVCGSGSATINLSGLVANSIGNVINYSINSVPQTPVIGVNANGSGNASFTTPSLTTANNGQILQITGITNGNCTSSFSQNVILNVTTTYTWTGTVSTNWDVDGNWSCGIAPTSVNDVIIPVVANLPVVSSTGVSACHNITINANASVTVSSTKDLSVYGNWTNNGVSTVGSGTVIFTGGSAQTVSGVTKFGNLTINNLSGVTLSGNTQLTGVLTPTQGNLASNGYLTLLSTASQTALIAGTGTGNVTGDVTMQRYMPNKRGYHYYSSPFNGAPITEFTDELGTIITGDPYVNNDTTHTVTPFPNFFIYDETPPYTMSIGWTGASSTLETMRGYCINFGSSTAAITTDVTGVVNNGPLSYGVTRTTSTHPSADGWNLVGNPYPSPINWQASGWTKTNISNGIYYFKPNAQYTGTYSSFVNGIGVNGGSGIISSMQGFLIRATANGTLGVTNSVRVNNLTTTFYKAQQVIPLLRLKGYPSANQSYGDETVIYFDSLATSWFDNDMDAYKMMNNDPNYPNIFTKDSSNSTLSIDALPPLTNMDVVIPLGYVTKTSGSFKIKATEILNFDPTVHIYLEDNSTSTSQDLTINPEYTFNITANEPLYRFFIRFSPTIITEIPENTSTYIDAWSSGKDIYISCNTSKQQQLEVSVYDMLGRKIIYQQQDGSGMLHYTLEKPGCYVVDVVSGNKTYQKKVIIM